MQKDKPKKCRHCGKEFVPKWSSTEVACSFSCAVAIQSKKEKKPRPRIPHFSTRRKKENPKYLKKRKEFLARPENQICFIGGCGKKATTIEHIKGRSGDLYLDEKFWRPCCLEHNLELENNPELSAKYQLSKIHDGKKI